MFSRSLLVAIIGWLLLSSCATGFVRSELVAEEYYKLALEYRDLGRTSDAMRLMESVVQYDASLAVARFQLALMYLDAGDYVRAQATVSDYQKAVRAHDDSHLMELQSYYYARTGEYRSAIQSFLALIDVDGGNHDRYVNIGLCYEFLGHSDEALRYFLLAQEMSPSSMQAAIEVAAMYARRDDYTAALLALEPFADALDDNFRAASLVVEASSELGNYALLFSVADGVVDANAGALLSAVDAQYARNMFVIYLVSLGGLTLNDARLLEALGNVSRFNVLEEDDWALLRHSFTETAQLPESVAYLEEKLSAAVDNVETELP